jgi:GxxExxY protein
VAVYPGVADEASGVKKRGTTEDTEDTERRRGERMEERDPVTGAVIAAAIEVHRLLGPGLLESIYQRALCHEMHLRGLPFQGQQPVPVAYKGVNLGDDLRLDLVVADQLIVELKAVDKLLPIHEAQLITYLKLTGLRVGLLINFNVRLLKEGIKRIVL